MIKVQYFRTALYDVFIHSSATGALFIFLPLRHKGGKDFFSRRFSLSIQIKEPIFFLSSAYVIAEAKFGSDFTSPWVDVFGGFHGSFHDRSTVACQ